jgi:hypothetical protein
MKTRQWLIVRGTVILAVLAILALAVALTQAQGPKPTEPITAQAALGTAFTYQGRLTDGGNPANGMYDFLFGLWSGGDLPDYQVNKDDVTVTDGLFTVQLDFGSNVFRGGLLYELGISVRPGSSTGAYTTLSPRQALTPAPYALALPGLWTQQSTTSPNLIGGYIGNSVTAGVYGATIGGGGRSGDTNRVTDNYGTVGGGHNNRAGDNVGTTSDHPYATVGGGGGNTASGSAATVGGGWGNTASGDYTTVGGGASNQASGDGATVGGGSNNLASSEGTTVGGGNVNTASGDGATVGGGWGNTASGYLATVGGGDSNTAQGDYSFAAGRRAKANHNGSFVLADSTNADFTSVRENALRVRFNGGATFVVNDGYWVRFWSSGDRLIEASNGAYLTTDGVWTNASGSGGFPRPAYDSGWVNIGQGETKFLTHGLGGDPDNYVVDLQFKQPAGIGINQISYGGDKDDIKWYGAEWYGLTNTTIAVRRRGDDVHAHQIRVRIWVYR